MIVCVVCCVLCVLYVVCVLCLVCTWCVYVVCVCGMCSWPPCLHFMGVTQWRTGDTLFSELPTLAAPFPAGAAEAWPATVGPKVDLLAPGYSPHSKSNLQRKVTDSKI